MIFLTVAKILLQNLTPKMKKLKSLGLIQARSMTLNVVFSTTCQHSWVVCFTSAAFSRLVILNRSKSKNSKKENKKKRRNYRKKKKKNKKKNKERKRKEEKKENNFEKLVHLRKSIRILSTTFQFPTIS